MGYPQIIHLNGTFHYKASIWGTPIICFMVKFIEMPSNPIKVPTPKARKSQIESWNSDELIQKQKGVLPALKSLQSPIVYLG